MCHLGYYNNVLKIKTELTRNNIIKYWKLSIGLCQSSSANEEYYWYFSCLIDNHASVSI